MLSLLNEVIWDYIPLLLTALVILLSILIWLQIKNYLKQNKKEQVEVKQEKSIFEKKIKRKDPLEEAVQKEISLDPKIVRLQTHFLNVLRNLTVDAKELGFTYDSDTIQYLLADWEKVLTHYLKNIQEFEKAEIPFLPCIPVNQHNPRQMMETLYRNGSVSGLCNIDIQKLEQTVPLPKKTYWIFGVDFKKTEPDKIFCHERKEGLAINELIFAASFVEDLWRNKNTQLFSIITLSDRIPLIFRFNLRNEVPEIKAFSEKESAREYYLATCKDRVCFAE